MDAPKLEIQLAESVTLDNKIATASGMTAALGGLGVFASIMQMFGVIRSDVPGWFNLLIAASAIALALNLKRRSLWLTGALLAIFIAIVADTLIATGYVLDRGGVFPTILVVIRYLILLSAAKAVGEVFRGILDAQKQEQNRGPLGLSDGEASTGQKPAAAPLPLDGGRLVERVPPTVYMLYGMAGLLVFGGIIYAAAVPLKGMGAAIFLAMPIGAILAIVGAFAERKHLPGLVQKLRSALARGATEDANAARNGLLKTRGLGARALAVGALDALADPSPDAGDYAFAKEAFDLIAKIGEIDREAAAAIHRRVLESPSGREDDGSDWSAVASAAQTALANVGYESASANQEMTNQ